MFARIAKVLTVACRPEPAQVRQATSKIQNHDSAGPALRRRPAVLTCRWQLDPASGRPVCAWEVESPDLAPDLMPELAPDPDVSPASPMQQPQSLRRAARLRVIEAAGVVQPGRRT